MYDLPFNFLKDDIIAYHKDANGIWFNNEWDEDKLGARKRRMLKRVVS
jgi:hypothetical protein